MSTSDGPPDAVAPVAPASVETAGVPSAALRVVGVERSFGGQKVLAGVDLCIPRGSVTFIVGPSGTGKSVLLKHLIGLIAPQAGHIYLGDSDDIDITRLTGPKLNDVRRRFGVLFQNAALFDSMNVFDNVAFPLVEHRRLSKKEVRERVLEKLEQVGLPGVEQKFPSELSGGMRKRVGLARAIILDPEIIFYDEPTTGLDPLMVEQIDELIAATNRRQQATSVVISHDIPALFSIADYGAVLYKGRILTFGPPSSLRDHPDPFVNRFIGKGLLG